MSVLPPRLCPTCHAPLDDPSSDACPRCLMAAAMIPTGQDSAAPRPAAPTLAEVAAAFPQLEILELIGQGGMGCVFKARQPKLDRLVALKLLPASLVQRDAAFAGRFEREGQLLARLHHPNIVAVHDSGSAGEFFYLIMEFVDGVNLRQAMRTRPFTPAQALAIVPHICDALQYAHEEGVLHRDIKPENILLDGRGRVKLADFGIAKLLGTSEPAATSAAPAHESLTHSGSALGTPSYMAPEQRETPAAVDHRADIYSLGVVFYELLTGELPQDRFAPPSAKSSADPRVDAIVQQALEKERDRRQQSAGEVRTQVEAMHAAAAQSPAATPHSLRTSIVFLAVLFAVVATLFLALAPRFTGILQDFGAQLPIVTRWVLKLSEGLAAAVFPALFAISVAGCFALRAIAGRIGVRIWLVLITLGLFTFTGLSAIALFSPINTLIHTLRSDAEPAAVVEPSPAAAPPVQIEPLDHVAEASLEEYRELLTELADTSLALELIDTSDDPEPEKQRQRLAIKARCERLALQTSALRDRILALGRRASESAERYRFPVNENATNELEK